LEKTVRRRCRCTLDSFVVLSSPPARPGGSSRNFSIQAGGIMSDTRVAGPASYFPSIEKKYGHPVAYWFDLLKQREGDQHMQLVAWLKNEHGLGHGHANALVAYYLSKPGGAPV
jgi:hypothetical protein